MKNPWKIGYEMYFTNIQIKTTFIGSSMKPTILPIRHTLFIYFESKVYMGQGGGVIIPPPMYIYFKIMILYHHVKL